MRYAEPIPDSPEDIAREIMSSPRNWRYLEGDETKRHAIVDQWTD